MALVQSTKNAGGITIEATSPGIVTASVTIAATAAKLRPQVAVWERPVPTGSGITGLWRPVPPAPGGSPLLAMLAGGGDMVYTLRQQGSKLTGSVEGGSGGFLGGDDVPAPIEDGKVDGDNISFKAGRSTYTGTVKDGELNLQRSVAFPFARPAPVKEVSGGPAIGPPPDGSDPSLGAFKLPSGLPVVLRRAKQ